MDKQDGQDMGLKHEQITESVIGCAFDVLNKLGLLINFGNPNLEHKRYTRSQDFEHG